MAKVYIPISKRKNIEDKDIAKIIDYIERHGSIEEFHSGPYCVDLLVNGKWWFLRFSSNESFIGGLDVKMPLDMMANNISGIYQGYYKKGK